MSAWSTKMTPGSAASGAFRRICFHRSHAALTAALPCSLLAHSTSAASASVMSVIAGLRHRCWPACAEARRCGPLTLRTAGGTRRPVRRGNDGGSASSPPDADADARAARHAAGRAGGRAASGHARAPVAPLRRGSRRGGGVPSRSAAGGGGQAWPVLQGPAGHLRCWLCSSLLLSVRYQVIELPPVSLIGAVQGVPAGAVGEVLAGLDRLVLDLGRVVVRYALPADEQDRAGREHDLSQLGVSVGLAGDGEQVIKGHAGLIACGNLVFAVARIGLAPVALGAHTRSEERRVGKECRSRW